MRLYGCCARALEGAASAPNARDHEINAWSLGPPGDKTLVQLERVKEAAAELAGTGVIEQETYKTHTARFIKY